MTESTGTDAMDALRAGIRHISASVTRTEYLAEQADVDGEPQLAALLRAMTERNRGLAQGLYALLAEETETADARPGVDDLLERLPSHAAHHASLAEELRAGGRDDLASWMDKLAAAQHDHLARLADARHWNAERQG
ncbi:MAG: hypothetical protein ACO3PD_14045 [Acidimicrobiales bacterium]